MGAFYDESYYDALEWVKNVAEAKKGLALPPPTYLVEYPDLLERGWGWERLVAYDSRDIEWCDYKKYLMDYFTHNAGQVRILCGEQKPETVGEGVAAENGDLHAAAKLCLKLERKLLSQHRGYLTPEDILLSKDIKKHAKDLIELKVESSFAAAGMVCVAKEAELIVKLPVSLSNWNTAHMITVGNQIRRSALKLMPFRGSKSADAVAGAMLGLAIEAQIVQGYLISEDPCLSVNCDISKMIRECTSVLLTQLEDELALEAAEDEEKSKLEKSKLEKRKKPAKETLPKKMKLNGGTETKLHTGATVAVLEELKAEGQLGREEFSEKFTVFVDNLPVCVNNAQLMGLFKQAGSVTKAQVIYDKLMGRSHGFGFVTMSSLKEVEAAVKQFHGYVVDGKSLRVNPSSQRGPRGDASKVFPEC